MLDDEHGIAERLQPLERLEQAVIVLLVEPDRGFVEDVEHAREAAADLAGEADALALAARQRAAGAVEVEIIEPDIVEEAEPGVDLLEDRAGDLALLPGELVAEPREPAERILDRAARRQRNVLAGDLDAQRLGLEPRAVAHFAGVARLVAGQFLAHPRAFGRRHAALEIAEHALERLLHLIALAPVDEAQRHRLALGAAQHDLARFLGQFAPRRGEVEVVGAGEAAEHLHVIRRGRVGLGPRHDRALGDRQGVVGDDEILVEQHLFAKAVARRAGALRGVEREQARLDLGDGEARDGAGEFFGEDDAAGGAIIELHRSSPPLRGGAEAGLRLALASLARGWGREVGGVEIGQPLGQLQRGLEAVGEAVLDPPSPSARWRCGRRRLRCHACISCRARGRPRSRRIRRRCARG